MNTTAQQLRLAADILETGHPWEFRGIGGFIKPLPGTPVVNPVVDGNEIRPILATPPDGRPLHNPDNLTAEQVGVGYRLTLGKEEWSPNQEFWYRATQKWERSCHFHQSETFRLPLSIPWPAPVDPYAELKAAHAAGKVIQFKPHGCSWEDNDDPDWTAPMSGYRIKPEPETFTAHGKTWTRHVPGDPMPCEGGANVLILVKGGEILEGNSSKFGYWGESCPEDDQIIGWRYAEPATKQIELGPEDVPPESVLTRAEESDFFAADEPGEWATVINVDRRYGCTVSGFRATGIPSLYVISWEDMRKQGVKINRPRHRDADGNPTLWEKCSKEVPA